MLLSTFTHWAERVFSFTHTPTLCLICPLNCEKVCIVQGCGATAAAATGTEWCSERGGREKVNEIKWTREKEREAIKRVGACRGRARLGSLADKMTARRRWERKRREGKGIEGKLMANRYGNCGREWENEWHSWARVSQMVVVVSRQSSWAELRELVQGPRSWESGQITAV